MTTPKSKDSVTPLSKAAAQAAVIVFGCVVLALAVNAFRSDGLPLVRHEAYDILVPCPEPVGNPKPLQATDPRVKDSKSLLLDVRSAEEFERWHMPGAINQPFDWLGPPVDSEVRAVAKRVAASGARRVIVYGDGDDPDSGRQWARLLSGARIKHVFYVQGGAPALNPALPKPSTTDDEDDVDDDEEVDGTAQTPRGSSSSPPGPGTTASASAGRQEVKP